MTWHVAMLQAISMDYFCVPFVCDFSAHWTIGLLDYSFALPPRILLPVGTESHTKFTTEKEGGEI